MNACFKYLLAVGAAGLGWLAPLGAADVPLPKDYRLLYEQDFKGPEALRDFVFTDRQAWRIAAASASGEPGALELHQQSQYEPKVRSPINIAILADKVFTDFILEVEMKQTGREYGHRDMCLFFGVKDPSHFYYSHLATKADDHAHNVFIVNDSPRAKFADKTTEGVQWGLETWHKIRLERKGSDGSIRVFFDDLNEPIMTANDKSFASGYIGFGSFDDTGMMTRIRVWGPSMETRSIPFYQR